MFFLLRIKCKYFFSLLNSTMFKTIYIYNNVKFVKLYNYRKKITIELIIFFLLHQFNRAKILSFKYINC